MGQQHTGRPNGERVTVGGRARPYDAPQTRAVAPQNGRSRRLHNHTSSVWWFLGTRRPPTSLAFSGVRISCDPTRLHGGAEGRMVLFGLVGIGLRKVGDRPVEALALAQVAGDLNAITGSGVRPGQRPAAEAGIDDQFIGRHALDISRALHVLELAPVEVASFRAAKPAEEDVARRLHQPLPGHHAVSVLLVGARRNVALQYRGSRLLDLEEQGVILVAALEQHYVGPCTHTTDPHNLPCCIHKAEPVEQVAPIVLQGSLVALEDGVDLNSDLVSFGDADQDRWIVDHRPASVDDLGQLGESLQAVVAVRLPHSPVHLFRGFLGPRGGEQIERFFLANAQVPDLELSHLRELGHPPPVRGRGHPGGLAAIRGVKPVVAARHHEARGEALDVPLPWPGQGLVEVVEVEEQGALGRGIQPEVREVGVAAQLRLDATLRRACEVVGHDDGRPTHERERGGHHTRVPDWQKVRNPVPGLRLQEVNRVRPIGRRLPLCMAAPRDHLTRGAPAFVTSLVARGLLRRPRREVRVLLDFHVFLLHNSEIAYAPGHESLVRPANGVRYGYRLVSGAQVGRSSSRRSPAPLRSLAGLRSALGWTSPFVSRAVDSRASWLPATATTLR